MMNQPLGQALEIQTREIKQFGKSILRFFLAAAILAVLTVAFNIPAITGLALGGIGAANVVALGIWTSILATGLFGVQAWQDYSAVNKASEKVVKIAGGPTSS